MTDEKRACRNCHWRQAIGRSPAWYNCDNPLHVPTGRTRLPVANNGVCDKHVFGYEFLPPVDPKETPMTATEFVITPDPLVAPVEMSIKDVPEGSAFTGTIGEATGLFVCNNGTAMMLTDNGRGYLSTWTCPTITITNYRHVKRLAMIVEYEG